MKKIYIYLWDKILFTPLLVVIAYSSFVTRKFSNNTCKSMVCNRFNIARMTYKMLHKYLIGGWLSRIRRHLEISPDYQVLGDVSSILLMSTVAPSSAYPMSMIWASHNTSARMTFWMLNWYCVVGYGRLTAVKAADNEKCN